MEETVRKWEFPASDRESKCTFCVVLERDKHYTDKRLLLFFLQGQCLQEEELHDATLNWVSLKIEVCTCMHIFIWLVGYHHSAVCF